MRHRLRIAACLFSVFACAALAPGVTLAIPIVINFDTLSPGTVDTQFAAQGVVFSGDIVVRNDNFSGTVIVPSGSNYVTFSTGMTITFVDPTHSGVDATTDFVSFVNLGLHSPGTYNGLTVSVRNLLGVELATATVPPVGPFVERESFTTSFSLPGIHALVFTNIPNPAPTGEGIVGFDDLSFNAVTPEVLAGDYNHNGIVDAADFVMWRKAVGTQTPLDNDPLGVPIDQDQYDQWRSHFGQPAGSGAALRSAEPLSTVPEPTAMALLMMAAVGLCLLGRRAT